jgi:hypothetical protein
MDINSILSMIVQDLRHNNLGKLVDLVKKAEVNLEYLYHDNWDGGIDYHKLVLYLKYADYTAISEKKQEYEDMLGNSLHSFYNDERDVIQGVEIAPRIEQYVDWAAVPDESKESIIKMLNEESSLLVKTGTGQTQIQEVNTQYKALHYKLTSTLKKMCLEHINPYSDLWDWYNDYKNRSLSTYQSRRAFVKEMYASLIEVIENSDVTFSQMTKYVPTGWDKVDESAIRMREVMLNASITSDYQSVGMYGRELLISLAQVVFDKDKHPSVDGTDIGNADSKRMLEAYIHYCMSHKGNPRAVKFAKSSVDFSNELTHNRTATEVDAELCYTAVISTINLIRILHKNAAKEAV